MSDQTFTKTPSNISVLLARSFCYGLLGDLLSHPVYGDAYERVHEMGGDWQRVAPVLPFKKQDKWIKLFRELFTYIDQTGHSEWTKEYDHCFGHTAHGCVPAYELEYGEEHSHRQPHQLADIAAFYNAFGLQVNQEVGERVDHVTVECEFMSFLLYKEAYAMEHDGEEKAAVCREAARHFLADHLASWVPSFARRLSKSVEAGLMKAIAEFAFSFIVEDTQSEGLSVGSLDMPIRAIAEGVETGCVSCLSKSGFETDTAGGCTDA